jgi:hypothetical protein
MFVAKLWSQIDRSFGDIPQTHTYRMIQFLAWKPNNLRTKGEELDSFIEGAITCK